MKKRVLALILMLAMVLTMLAACGDPAANNTPAGSEGDTEVDTIKIGVLIPLSGGSATSGTTMSYVADTVVDYINNELGGIKNLGGAKIELVYGDTQSDASVSASEFERLMEAGCSLFIGGYNSPITQSLAPLVISNDQIMIMTNGYADAAYTQPNDNIYHVSGATSTNSQNTIDLENWKRENLEGYTGKVYGYIYTASDYGRDAYDALVATQEASGVDEIVAVPVESGATDLSSVLMQLKSRDDIEYLSCAIPMSDAILFIRQCQQYDVTVPIFAGGSGFIWADILEQIGESSDYLYSTGTHFADYYRNVWDPELAKSYNDACKEDLGWLPDENYACMWGDIWTAWDVLERTASLSVEDLKQAFRETNITGDHMALLMTAHESITFPESYTDPVTGNVLYNQNPDQAIMWAMSKDGEYRIVWPEKWANPDYPVVYPVPSWEDR